MATSNVVIAGATYPDVPAVTLNKSGGGTASYVNISDTTATASDAVTSKNFYMADGTKVSGSITDARSSGYTVGVGDVATDGTNVTLDLTSSGSNPYGVATDSVKAPYNAAALGIGLIDNPSDTTSAKIASGNTILGITGTGGGGTPTPPTTPTDAVIFYSLEPFTLHTYNKTKNWNGTLYYSTDYSTWNTWAGTNTLTAVQSDGYYKLYVRGSGNTYLTTSNGSSNARLCFVGWGIKGCGNLNNLLNYNNTVTMATYAFAYLFYNAQAVDFDVTLPSTSLKDYCYRSMFQYSGIRKAPKLPATTLATGCYNGMLSNCYSLEAIPALPATTLTNTCYQYMFNNSLAVKFSTTQTGEYQTAYCIPTSGTGTVGTNSLSNMFQGTGGTFTGTPTINTTYYTSNTVIS